MSRSHSWLEPFAGASLLCALSLGCASEPGVPTLGASADVPPSGGAEVADDPIRQELRGLYAACEERRAALVEDLDHAERRYTRIRGAAAIAWFVGEILGGEASRVGDLTESSCLAPDGAGVGTARCHPQAIALGPTGESYDPAREDVRTVALDGREQLVAINRTIDRTDTLLFAHPDPQVWTPAEWERWEELSGLLQQLCE